LHTLLLGLTTTFREKLEWLEEAETLALRFRANRQPDDSKKDRALPNRKLHTRFKKARATRSG
jgi:hypothetical protein